MEMVMFVGGFWHTAQAACRPVASKSQTDRLRSPPTTITVGMPPGRFRYYELTEPTRAYFAAISGQGGYLFSARLLRGDSLHVVARRQG